MSRVAPALRAEWSVWLVVHAGLATLRELETTWTVDDLNRAVDFLRIRADVVGKLTEDKP